MIRDVIFVAGGVPMPILEIVLSLIGGGVVAIVIERLYTRWRADAGDYELWLQVRSLTLTAEAGDRFETGLTYVVDGKPVAAPYVVEVDIWNAGSKDIRAEMFHQGNPIEVDLKVPVVKPLVGDLDHETSPVPLSNDPSGVIRIGPGLIRQKMFKRFRLLTDGKPDLVWRSDVADMDVFDFDREWDTPTADRKIARVLGRVLAIALTLGLLTMMVSPLFVPLEVRRELIAPLLPLGVVVLVPGFLFMLCIALFMYAGNASRRPRRAARVRSQAVSRAPKTSSEQLYRAPSRDQGD